MKQIHHTNLTSEIYSKDRTIDTLSLICIGAGAVALLAVLYSLYSTGWELL